MSNIRGMSKYTLHVKSMLHVKYTLHFICTMHFNKYKLHIMCVLHVTCILRVVRDVSNVGKVFWYIACQCTLSIMKRRICGINNSNEKKN